MAIPFHTPSEYGPVRAPNNINNNHPPAIPDNNNNNNSNRNNIDLRNERNRAQVEVRHNQVPLDLQRNPQQQAQEQVGFVQQLFLELFSLYEQYAMGLSSREREVRPERDPLAAPPANRRFQLQQDQINQTSTGAGPSTPPQSPRLPLPDIIQCHAQLSFNFCTAAINNSNNANDSNFRRNELPVRVPLHLQPMEDSDEESVDFSLKIGFEIYRKTGRDLREIADDLQQNYNRQNRRRHCRRSRLRLSLDMDLMLTVAVPALALLGGLGFYVFRR